MLGQTGAKGAEPKERPVKPREVAVTLYEKQGIDHGKVYVTPQDRPVKVVDSGTRIKELG